MLGDLRKILDSTGLATKVPSASPIRDSLLGEPSDWHSLALHEALWRAISDLSHRLTIVRLRMSWRHEYYCFRGGRT